MEAYKINRQTDGHHGANRVFYFRKMRQKRLVRNYSKIKSLDCMLKTQERSSTHIQSILDECLITSLFSLNKLSRHVLDWTLIATNKFSILFKINKTGCDYAMVTRKKKLFYILFVAAVCIKQLVANLLKRI